MNPYIFCIKKEMHLFCWSCHNLNQIVESNRYCIIMDYLDDSYLLSDENKVCLKCKAEYPMVRVFVSVKDAKDALRDVIIWCARNKDKIENDLKFLSKRFICKSKSSHPPSHTSN